MEIIYQKTNKEKIYIYIYHGILFGHKKEENTLWDNMGISWGYYAKWSKSEKDDIVWCYMHADLKQKQTKFIVTQNILVVTSDRGRGNRGGPNGWRKSKGTNFPLKHKS